MYRRFDDPILNVLMFVPLGAFIGVLERRSLRLGLAVAGLLFPLGIEATQAVVVPLGRACQAGDIFDNSAGLVIGLALGWAAGALWRAGGSGQTAP